MHHESELSDELKQALKTLTADTGPTGQFPGGKLTSTDEGEIRMGISAYHGSVILHFGKPIASLGLSPQQARNLALSLRQQANFIERNPEV